jgi:hypothetical protein
LIEIQVSINGLQISNLLNSSIEFFPDIMMVVSSAKRILLNGIESEKSLTNKMYRRGPNMLPCGTPDIIGRGVDKMP